MPDSSSCKTDIQWNWKTIGYLQMNDGRRADGQLIASSTPDGSISLNYLLFDPTPEQQKLPTLLSGHSAPVTAIAFSPDGQTLASGSADKTVKIWNLETGKSHLTFFGHAGTIELLAFSPNEKLLASSSNDNIIKLWDLETGNLLQTLSGHTDKIQILVFSADEKMLASGSRDRTIKLWNSQGELLQTLTGHTGEIISFAFSPDGKIIASGSKDNTVKLWDVPSGKLKQSLNMIDPEKVLISTDGQILESLGSDRTLQWNLTTGKQICLSES